MAAVQALALLTMLIDHLGSVGILDPWSRLVGRVAMPAFVLMLAFNAAVTARPLDLLRRLGLLLVISQPVYMVALGHLDRLSILVTLLVVAALVVAWRQRDRLAFVLVLGCFLVLSPWVEYGPWPLLLAPVMVAPGALTLALALAWPWVQYPPALFQVVALVALVALLLMLRYPLPVPRLPRWLTRWFYPGHLVAVGVMSAVIT